MNHIYALRTENTNEVIFEVMKQLKPRKYSDNKIRTHDFWDTYQLSYEALLLVDQE